MLTPELQLKCVDPRDNSRWVLINANAGARTGLAVRRRSGDREKVLPCTACPFEHRYPTPARSACFACWAFTSRFSRPVNGLDCNPAQPYGEKPDDTVPPGSIWGIDPSTRVRARAFGFLGRFFFNAGYFCEGISGELFGR